MDFLQSHHRYMSLNSLSDCHAELLKFQAKSGGADALFGASRCFLGLFQVHPVGAGLLSVAL